MVNALYSTTQALIITIGTHSNCHDALCFCCGALCKVLIQDENLCCAPSRTHFKACSTQPTLLLSDHSISSTVVLNDNVSLHQYDIMHLHSKPTVLCTVVPPYTTHAVKWFHRYGTNSRRVFYVVCKYLLVSLAGLARAHQQWHECW